MGKHIHTRVYVKPLLPTDFQVDVKKVLESTKRQLHKRIKQELEQETFSPRAKKALTKAITITVKANSLQVKANHPAFKPLVLGQKKGQMRWLTKADKPIPIITDTGKMIFRSATAKSMADGKWIHPGRKPSTYIDRAKKVAREHIKSRMEKEVRKQVQSAFRKAAR